MEVLIQENDIIVVRGILNSKTGKEHFFTWGLKHQIKSARDLNPELGPLDKDIYLIEIGNKAAALKLLEQGKVSIYGDVVELKKLLVEED